MLAVPFAFLALWAAGLPLPAPEFLVPRRTYLALGESAAKREARTILSRPPRSELYLVLPDRLVALPPAKKAREDVYAAQLARLPETPVFAPIIDDMAQTPRKACGFRIMTERKPSAEELRAIRQAAGLRHVSLEIQNDERSPVLQAATRRLDSFSGTTGVELLFSPEAARASRLLVLSGDGARPLFDAPGPSLSPDRKMSIPVERLQSGKLSVIAKLAQGRTVEQKLSFESAIEWKPRILVISERASPSLLDSLYDSTKVDPAHAAEVDFASFELIVLDGIPLASLRGSLASRLRGALEKRSSSLLFVSDSPDFGIKGANPDLEAVLPVTLLPRSLKNLPDMAILILLDISGSMFGDKLSLAKVSGLELFRNLKPDDCVGLMLFSDTREWTFRFARNSDLKPALPLEPITARGGTELGPALREGVEALSLEASAEKHIVVISDGISKPYDFPALAREAAALGISVSTMGVGGDANRSLLASIASRTGGGYYQVDSAERIPALIFEDRTSVARSPFVRGKIPILALDGSGAGEVSGMAQYTAQSGTIVPFSNEWGDPLFASREFGNRACLFFASDIHGGMTGDFFSVPRSLSLFKSRLDALFTPAIPEVTVAEMYGLTQVMLRGERMVQPCIVFSRSGYPDIEAPFVRSASGLWSAASAIPESGAWHARIVDRGTVVGSFSLMVNHGFSGRRTLDEKAFLEFKSPFIALLPVPEIWLLPFFASCLASSLLLRSPKRASERREGR